jgi:protein ImuB
MEDGEARMNPESVNETLYACVHAAEFPAQSLLRLHPEMQSEPFAVLEGQPPMQTICSLNRLALLKGAAHGMTRLEAESIAGLRLVHRSLDVEASARDVLRECAANFSPRIEDSSCDTACACLLDIAGTERLFGPPETLAARLRSTLAAAGFRASIAVSANFHTARIKAAATRGITMIRDGEEAASIARLPLSALNLDRDHAETFAIWGIRTLGDLAALPEVDLIARLGQPALRYRALASGALSHAFQPIQAAFSLREFCDFETPVDQADSLLFMGARMIDCLVARAAARALALASITIEMSLAGGRVHQRVLRPALASCDRKFLLKLLQLEIAAHPPPAAVAALTLTAQAGQSSKVQLGLFAPQMPEPSRLDVTLARLKAIAGEDRVGSPVLIDTHRPGAFHMEDFSLTGKFATPHADGPRMALRRIRPPALVRVMLNELKPVAFRDRERSFQVEAAYGPWRSSGCWWSAEGWDAEEWDVLARATSGASVACLLVHDCVRNQWHLEALYD